MKQILERLVALILVFSSILGTAPTARAARSQPVVEGNTAFALELYGRFKTNQGNLFFSPYSISTALAMTYAGARGETEKQMARVFHFDQAPQKLHASFGELQRQLNEAAKQKGIELSIANALWAQKGHPFLPAYLEVAKGNYQGNVNQADFKIEAETASNEINHWVARKTRDKIQNILPPGNLDGSTRLVLANAIYFKGVWAKPYDKGQTSTQPFHRSLTSLVDLPLMYHFDDVRYAENSDFQAVELPYRGNALSMMVLLPRKVDACGELENRLSPRLISHTLAQMKRQEVEIFLPRFTLESGFDLSGALAGMGMPDAFGPKSDFSGMDGTRLLYISGIFHKAWAEVNEEGTEAAAVTTAVAVPKGEPKPLPPHPVFLANHPFIFFIRDTRSGSLLFLGRFAASTN